MDLIKASVLAALGEKVNVVQKPYNGYWAEVILHSKDSGKFEKIDISGELTGEIVETDLWVSPGEKIGKFSGANEAIGTLILRYSSAERMDREMNRIDDLVRTIVG